MFAARRPTITIWDCGPASSLTPIEAEWAARLGDLLPADFAMLSDDGRVAVLAAGLLPLELQTPEEATAGGHSLHEYAEAKNVRAIVHGKLSPRRREDGST